MKKSLFLSKPIYFADTNQNQQNIFRQEKFLNRMLNRLETDEAEVLQELEQVCKFCYYEFFSIILEL